MECARAPLLPALVGRRAEPRGACQLLRPVPPRDRRPGPSQQPTSADSAPESERSELRRHADEEASHIALWDGFVEAVGGEVGAAPTVETKECVDAWTASDDRVSQLVRLYAIESGQPAISKTKREGLAAHYGIEDGPGNEYFRVHEVADVEHAAEGRSMIEAHLADADPDALVEAAESVFKANWRLLDGVTAA